VGLGLLNVGVSRTQSHITRRSPLAEWSALRSDLYPTQTITRDDIQAHGRIRAHNPRKLGPADPRLRQRSERDRQGFVITWLLRNKIKFGAFNFLLIILQPMITITTTKIIVHPETSAAALSIIQCLTGSVTLLQKCMPAPPV